MLLTINTDASFNKEHKIGGFAFWAVCDDFKITKFGVFKDNCIDADDAEMKCILNAFHCIFLEKKALTKIIVNTDSLNSIHLFTNNIKMICRWRLGKHKVLRKMFNRRFLDKGIKIEFRHVKAHTGDKNARSYVNEWCDKNAKQVVHNRVFNLVKINQS